MDEIVPPVAEQRDKILSIHGDDRLDEYYWIRDDERRDPDVLKLIAQENAYTKAMMAHSEKFQETLFDEISARLVADDRTVPVKTGNYVYFREYRQGGEYPVYIRAPTANQDAEAILLDANDLSTGHEFYQIGNWSVSPGETLLAYAEDTVSRRQYTLRFKDLESGSNLPDEIVNVSPAIAWAADNQTVFYVRKHPQTLLPYRVYRHKLGTPGESDVEVYEEKDDAFHTSVHTTRSRKYVVFTMGSTDSSEIRLVRAGDPDAEPAIFLPREEHHEYRIRHIEGMFYVLTNWQAKNFRLMKVKEEEIGDKSHWQEVIAHRPDVLLQDMEIFTNYLVVNERIDGLARIRVINLTDGKDRVIDFPDPAYTARLHANPEVDTNRLRYVYSSLTTPESTYEFNMESGESVLLKEESVLGGFDKSKYTSERKVFTARDGTRVPVSVVYRADLFKSGSNPVYIYAYGSYGYSANPTFLSKRLSLLDRGFVYAMVHVRGGEDMGRHWYEDGKLLNKKNTFNDFVDATQYLVAEGLADADNVFAVGGSAGGLLMGVIANEAPALYKGIVAHVPFVDVITTMLDESIPLTSGEFNEWGNPNERVYYDYMLSYSPYDQVKAQKYPNMLVTTGFYDSQVQYFEPVKWVSRLRRLKQDDNLLLIDINMDTGHGGSSGRYERHRLDALEYAFILELAGKS